MLLTHWEVETSQVKHRQAALNWTAPSKYYFYPKLGSRNSLTGVTFFSLIFFFEKKEQRHSFFFSPLLPHSQAPDVMLNQICIKKAERSDRFNPWASIFLRRQNFMHCHIFFFLNVFSPPAPISLLVSCEFECTPLSMAAQIRLL